ncbi:unnamed protein product, partial [Rotaria socialis]
MIAWENVTSLLNNTSTINDSAATIPVEQQATTTGIAAATTNSFIDISDVYVRGVNELIRQQCDSTSCLYLYLPR